MSKRKTPYDALPLVPGIVAEEVARRPYTGAEWSTKLRGDPAPVEALRQKMTEADIKRFADDVDEQCRLAYNRGQKWILDIMKSKTNRGRDTLYMYASHWLAGWLLHPRTQGRK